jgi:protein-S-isoprenylcysteine O-methyltransferase Ste14
VKREDRVIDWIPLLGFAAMFIASLIRSLSVRRETGVNPLAFVEARGVQRLTGLLFAASGALVAVAAVQIAWSGSVTGGKLPGAVLVSLGTAAVIVAQVQMGAAWRVGLRAGDAPLFVQGGLFRFSRNPIFLGMILLAIGTALIAGSVWSWAAAAAFALACHIQVMLEERHLQDSFGEKYTKFRHSVPRWLGVRGIGI